jgi:hypothetical protein
MTKEEKVKKVITAITNGLKSDLCKDGYPESDIDELNSILITALCEIVNEPSEQTTSLKAEVEIIRAELTKKEEILVEKEAVANKLIKSIIAADPNVLHNPDMSDLVIRDLYSQCLSLTGDLNVRSKIESLQSQLAKAEADKVELLEFIDTSIINCEKMAQDFYKDEMRFSEMSAEGMKRAYVNVRKQIETWK